MDAISQRKKANLQSLDLSKIAASFVQVLSASTCTCRSTGLCTHKQDSLARALEMSRKRLEERAEGSSRSWRLAVDKDPAR